ncbi:MAG TPA: glycosyltransferase [Acetobacteraceae bacterium]|nr:glycosyltransferase [Acetobacteraceae bacterium]
MPNAAGAITYLLDLRCLQDPNYAARGIGRHAAALLAHARTHTAGARLTGLTDPDLPDLPAHWRAMVDDLRTTAYPGALAMPCRLVQFAPMSFDPLFVARLLQHEAVPSATVVYDFIPFEAPDAFLPAPAARLDYHAALCWLARYRLFLPISATAAAGLVRHLGVAEADRAITGSPLGPGFEDIRPGMPRHVLMVGGQDRRKNAACAVRAHARCAVLQSAGIPLVIGGGYPPDWMAELRALASACGGRPELLELPGHVPDAALIELYRTALAVVVPSLAEGFSLPVIEAMAAGVPVLASDIGAHRELIDDPAALFAPDDDAALAAGLAALAASPAARAAFAARGSAVWPRYRAGAVAARFWSAIAARFADAPLAAPMLRAGRRPHIALLSPLPPQRSGVADYTAAMLPALARRAELHLFSDTPRRAAPQGGSSLAPLSAFAHLSHRFDRVVSVLGNHPMHLPILRMFRRHGGAAILHDARLLCLYGHGAGADHAAAVAARELGRPVSAADVHAWMADENLAATPFLGEAAMAEPLLVHAPGIAADIAARHGRAPALLPFAVYRPFAPAELTAEARAAARARLGLPADAPVIGSFGFVHGNKAPEVCIWALETLHGWGHKAHLLFVGGNDQDPAEWQRLADRLGLGRHVHFTGRFIDEAGYRDHLRAADAAIQLRRLPWSGISGALQDCIAAGLPGVANAGLADDLDAPSTIRRVSDSLSPVLVAEALADIFEAGADRRIAEAGRAAHQAARSPEAYAAALCTALGLD